MNDNLTGFQSNGSSIDLQQFYETTKTGEIDYTKPLPEIKDTTSTAESLKEAIKNLYTSLANRPELTKPNSDQKPGGIDQALYMLQSFPDQILAFFDQLPSPEDDFPNDLDKEIANLGEDALKKIGGGNAEKGEAMVRFAALHPEANVSEDLAALAASVREKAEAAAGNKPNATFVDLEGKAVKALGAWQLEENIRGLGLSDADTKALLFAQNVPDALKDLSPELQAAFKKAEAEAFDKLQTAFGIPADWLQTDSTNYEKMLGNELAANSDKSLSKMLTDGKITQAQYNELRTLLFNPDAATPHAGTLKPILQNIMEGALKGMQAEYQFPDGYSPPIDAAGYNAILNGTFSNQFSRLLNNPELKLTPDQKALLKNALLSEDGVAALPKELQAIFGDVKAAAIASLVASHGVPGTWAPDTEMLALAVSKGGEVAYAQAAIDQIKEQVGLINKLLAFVIETAKTDGTAQPIPPSNVVLIKNYMKAVSLALAKLQEVLYEVSMTDSNLSTLLNKMQNDDKISELVKQGKELQEVIEKQKKMDALGPLKAIFQWLINIILLIFAGPLGVMMLINSTAQAIKSASAGKDTKKIIMEFNFIADIAKTAGDIGKAVGGGFGTFLDKFISIFSTLALAIICPIGVGADILLGEGSSIKNITRAILPKKEADMVAMALQVTVQFVAAIALAIFTGGGSIGIAIAGFAKAMGDVALKVLVALEKFFSMISSFEKIMKFLRSAWDAVTKGTPIVLDKPTSAVSQSLKSFTAAADKHMNTLKQVEVLEGALDKSLKAEKTAKTALDALKSQGVSPDSPAYKTAAKTLQQASDDVATQTTRMEGLLKETQEAQNFVTNFVTYLDIGVQLPSAWLQAIPQIHSNILQAIIARLKGSMEASMVLVEQFIKLIKDLISKLMDMVTSVGQDIKNIGDSQQMLFLNASQAISNMYQG